jgi:hypothetical protein
VSQEPFTIVSGKTERGAPVFCVLLKRTYDIRLNDSATRAAETKPLLNMDVYYDYGDPEWSTVLFENDLAPYKLETDVVFIAKAYSPNGKPVDSMTIGVEVGGRRKVIRVLGDRCCRYRKEGPPVFTDPVPFTEMEMRYEKAYGGRDIKSSPGLEFSYPRNHMGTGIALKNLPGVVEGLGLPNLEDPDDLLTPDRVVLGEPERWNQQPLPQGLGWFQRTWYPRCSFVGAVPGYLDPDEEMREERLGLVPRHQIALARQFKLPSFDVRFNNGASIGLRFPYLAGDELIRSANLTPGGGITAFRLPGEHPRVMLDIGLGENELEVVLHTVCVRLEEMQVDLLWRGAHEYPGTDWLPEMKRMVAEVR